MRFLAGLVLALGCCAARQDVVHEPPTLAFEIRQTNHAKGFVWRGIMVDTHGAVMRYDASRLEQDWLKEDVNPQTLYTALKSESKTIGSVSVDDLKSRMKTVESIDAPKMGARKQGCWDYGQVLFLAYTADGRRLTLREAGDHSHASEDPQLQAVVAWLRDLDDAYRDMSCW